MSRAKRAIHRRHRPVLLAVGVVAAVTVAAGMAIARFGSPDQPATQPAHSASHPAHSASHSLPTTSSASLPTAGSSPKGGSSASSAADACAAEIRTTEAVVAAARTGAEHWREHVQARTDLLSGKNPEATTKAIWKRTRLAGPGDISALNSALTAQAKAAPVISPTRKKRRRDRSCMMNRLSAVRQSGSSKMSGFSQARPGRLTESLTRPGGHPLTSDGRGTG